MYVYCFYVFIDWFDYISFVYWLNWLFITILFVYLYIYKIFTYTHIYIYRYIGICVCEPPWTSPTSTPPPPALPRKIGDALGDKLGNGIMSFSAFVGGFACAFGLGHWASRCRWQQKKHWFPGRFFFGIFPVKTIMEKNMIKTSSEQMDMAWQCWVWCAFIIFYHRLFGFICLFAKLLFILFAFWSWLNLAMGN